MVADEMKRGQPSITLLRPWRVWILFEVHMKPQSVLNREKHHVVIYHQQRLLWLLYG
jgi:hypothetical protein